MIVATHSRRHRRLAWTLSFIAIFTVGMIVALALHPRQADYVPGEQVAGITNTLGRNLPPGFPAITYEDVTEAAGIRFQHFSGKRSSQLPEDMGSGAAWADYDNDGYPDLFLANQSGPLTMTPAEANASPARSALYHNEGNGTFTDVTDRAGLGSLKGQYMGAAWGDYDNDGHRDLLVTAYGENRLFRNEGKGRFREVTRPAGIGGRPGFWAGASWGDYDRDGWLDLYICGYVRYHIPRPEELKSRASQSGTEVPFTLNPSSYPAESNLLYHNNGNGTFTEVAKQQKVDNPQGRSLSAAWCDFDGDGWLDIYVNNDVSMHAFYRNTAGKRQKAKGKRNSSTPYFEDISVTSWACDYRGGMGIAIGDWDNSGDMDMFLTHWLAQENALYHNMGEQNAPDGKKKSLHFMDISDEVGLGQSSLDYVGWGTSFLDFDNDGRLDLAIANGSTLEEASDSTRLVAMKNQLYWNASSGQAYFQGGKGQGYYEVQDAVGDVLQQPNVGRGLAVADFDRDGAPDMVLTRNGGPALLLRNRGGSRNNWLAVTLRGTRSNRDAIGAKIVVKAGGVKQVRQLGATSSYLSQDDLTALFGLGAASEVEEMQVWWPSGQQQTFRKLAARRLYRLVEGGQPEALTPGRR